MTPQIPEYVVTFEAAMRPLVAAIALGLIWIGATRMEGPAQSRYATAGALSVVLIAWLAVAQYLGSANAYFAASENAISVFRKTVFKDSSASGEEIFQGFVVLLRIYREGCLSS